MPSFAGKVAVVTGAAGNLGRVVVLALTDQDAGVALVDSDTGALGTVHVELLIAGRVTGAVISVYGRS